MTTASHHHAVAPAIGPERGVFCNRTLNLSAIRAIGYDLDYTLVHYHVHEWEACAYEHLRRGLADAGWPVEALRFDGASVCRGLALDLELGNIVKANRFGYVKAARHGTRRLDFTAMRAAYLKTLVDVSLPRYTFVETLFGISEACMFAQLVDLFDAGRLAGLARGYPDVFAHIRTALDRAHREGRLKADIMAAPHRFVAPDPDVALTLRDQREAGKKIMLITNSDWDYARAMLRHALDPFIENGRTWRDLFDLTIFSARKPEFFTARAPIHELVSDDGLLRPVNGPLKAGGVYAGGDVATVERFLNLDGDSILYVGDHIFSDVIVSKTSQEWRTAMIVREIEDEVRALAARGDLPRRLIALMDEKTRLEAERARRRLEVQRLTRGYGPAPDAQVGPLRRELDSLRARIEALDVEIGPLAMESGRGPNAEWGLLMQTGNDKSLLTRQIEKYADIYTSRVSNFLHATPFAYFRSPTAILPHTQGFCESSPAGSL